LNCFESNFFFLTIPEEADAVSLRLRVTDDAKRFTLDRFDLLVEESLPNATPNSSQDP
jgi:hypothetical protein